MKRAHGSDPSVINITGGSEGTPIVGNVIIKPAGNSSPIDSFVDIESAVANANTVGLKPSKDLYVNSDGLCTVDDTNHDGENLQFDGVLVSNKEVLVSWDLSSFPIGATITDATLTVNWQANLIEVFENDVDIFSLSDGDEGWSETTVSCSNRPSENSLMQTFSWSPSGIATPVQQDIPLNANVISRMEARMGVGNISFLMRLGSLNLLSRSMESSDTNLSEAPRLTFDWNLVLI